MLGSVRPSCAARPERLVPWRRFCGITMDAAVYVRGRASTTAAVTAIAARPSASTSRRPRSTATQSWSSEISSALVTAGPKRLGSGVRSRWIVLIGGSRSWGLWNIAADSSLEAVAARHRPAPLHEEVRRRHERRRGGERERERPATEIAPHGEGGEREIEADHGER